MGKTIELPEASDLPRSSHAPRNRVRKYRVVVAMRPWVFHDKFAKKPDKNTILEMLLDKLKDKKLDDHFVVVVEG